MNSFKEFMLEGSDPHSALLAARQRLSNKEEELVKAARNGGDTEEIRSSIKRLRDRISSLKKKVSG